MKDFVVIFVLKPAVRISRKIPCPDFTFKEFDGDKRVIIARIEEKVGDQLVQTGLLFRVYISADNVQQARERAKGFVDGVVGLLTFSTNVGLPIPNEIIAYETTPNTQKREFMQVVYNPANVPLSRRTVNRDFFEKFVDSLFKQREEVQHNISRALRWYRMGTLTFDPFTKFSCFWIGLESLNPILQKKLIVGKEIRNIKCENCGQDVQIERRTISGIKCFITEKMKNPDLLRRFVPLRVNLMHGTCELGKIKNEAGDLTPKLIEVLFRAICFVLDFEDWDSLPFRETLENVPYRWEYEGDLIGNYSGNLGFDGRDPHLELNQSSIKLVSQDDDAVTFESNMEITSRIEPFRSFQQREVRMYGDKETKAKLTKSELKSKHQ